MIDTATATMLNGPSISPIRTKKFDLDHLHELPPSSPRSSDVEPSGPPPPSSSAAAKAGVVSKSKYKHASSVHDSVQPSWLTQGEAPNPSFVGFRNLMVLVIDANAGRKVVSNLRLMIENFKKYGVLICIRCHDYRRKDVVLGATLFFLVPCHLFVAYLIERVAAQHAKIVIGRVKRSESASTAIETETKTFQSTWWLVAFAHSLNATLNLVIASWAVYYHIHHPGIGTLCELHAVIVWLKTCSYAFTNRDLRHALLTPTEASALPQLYSTCPYPQNITLHNLTYFWWAPTLVYQPVYPRTERIRWMFVAKRAAEVVTLSIAIWIASAQYAVPLLQNSLKSISKLDLTSFLERVMKLSSISLFCWLCGFFAIFQSFLNLLAEIMTFGDREFYQDWWNSPNLRAYWSSWNMPVYQFMKRHIYRPLVGRGCPPILAQVIVFLFSGILHEMLVGVPTHNIIGVAFAGMMFQIPLIVLTDILASIKGLGGKTAGNVIFWVSFVLVGQPLAVLLYFFAWHAKYGSVSKPQIQLTWR